MSPMLVRSPRNEIARLHRAKRVARAARHQIKSMIGISTDVLLKKPGEIPRSQGKAVRVRDLRPKQP